MNNKVAEVEKEQKEDIRFIYLYVPLKTQITKNNMKGYGRHRFGMMGFKVVDKKLRITCCHMGVNDFINDQVKFDRDFGLNRIRLRLDGKDENFKAKKQYVEIPLVIEDKPDAVTLRGLNIVSIARKMFGSNHLHSNFLPLLVGSADLRDITTVAEDQQRSLLNSVVSAVATRAQLTGKVE